MSDRELRDLLEAVIEDIDSGRVVVRRAGTLARLMAPGLVAASLGLAACGGTPVGSAQDAQTDAVVMQPDSSVEAYGIPMADAGVDAGNIDLYGMIIEDAAVEEDADIIYPPYAAPPVRDYQ
ncbi:MAG: hypothetical protein ABI333_01080 [bacterium]